jgi:hypothetical protein
MTKLKITKANWDEVFSDTVRVPADARNCPNGTVIRIDHGSRRILAVARGVEPSKGAMIQMDEFLRDKLGVKLGEEIGSEYIRPANWHEKLSWYLHATNPAVHVPAWVAVISLGLGVLSIVLGALSIVLAICS